MKTKRILSSTFLLLAFISLASAQRRVDITLKDKSIVSCALDDISYMEIVEAANPGELDGVWYLGWKVTSSATTNSEGAEMLVFYASKMKWVKKASETMYDLTYSGDAIQPGSTFKAKREGSTTALTYTVFAMEGDMLVLKQATTRYYFYKSQFAAVNAKKPESNNYLSRQQYSDPAKLWASNIKGGYSGSQITPMGQHFERFNSASDDDKAWLADPNNQPDLAWHELSGKIWSAKGVNLYPFGSPVPADVNQHAIGDCSMCAVFASFAYIYPEWIKTLIEKNGNNYTVHMFDPKGNPVDVVVDNKIMCNSGGGVDQVTGKNGVVNWATIMEKALMKWETRFQCNKIGGIGTEHAAPPFTGNGASYSIGTGDRLYTSEYRLLVDYALSNGMISVGGFSEGGLQCGPLESVTGHAFTVMYADEGATYSHVMRNPWGNGGSVDGKLEVPMDRSVLTIVDFRLVFPGAQMAQYKKENLGPYTPPRFKPMPIDMNPSEEMLRMYNVRHYTPFPLPEDAEEDVEGDTEE